MSKFLPAGLALALAAPWCAQAASSDTPGAPAAGTSAELTTLRREIDTLRAAYEARLQALEQRLSAAEAAARATPSPAARATPSPAAPGTSTAASPAMASTVAARAAGGADNRFNPAISLILSGQYSRTSRDPAGYAITGFPLPPDAEVGPGSRGFSLGESELRLSASVDPWWRGEATIALHDGEAGVEEAYVQTTALGHGLTLKAGRFLSNVGYLNGQHAHTWDFVDAPLAYQALLGGAYGDDGVQLTWLAPTDTYLAFGAELGRGRSFPGSEASRNGAGMASLSAHVGGDLGDSHSWRAGLSVLNVQAGAQELLDRDALGTPVSNAFTGRSRVWIADAVWKWAPQGNASRTSFKLQGELLRSQRRGTLVYDVGGADSADAYRASPSGWYLQGVYQFMPRWRVGLRTERLSPGAPDFGANAAFLAPTALRPKKDTLLLDFSPSEFSRVRVQFGRDRSREGAGDNQLTLQYQMSLGAHGAHGY